MFENLFTIILSLLTIALIVIYLKIKQIYKYWKVLNINYVKPNFPFGNYGPSIMLKISIGELFEILYNKTSAQRFIGIFTGFTPTLMINDPDLIKRILITDFQYFSDRGFYINEKTDPLSGHLFSLTGKKWKNLRMKLSPAFTHGKLKVMVSTIVNCGVPLENYMKSIATKAETIEIREITARYLTNVIASVAFGIDVNAIDDPNIDFRTYGRKAFAITWQVAIKQILLFVYPKLLKLLHFKWVDHDFEQFVMSMIKQTLEYRETNNIFRQDFFQLLIQLRNVGVVQMDGHWATKINNDENNKKLTFNELAAQVCFFYMAGFETSSAVMSFCLYELAKNPDIQNKVQLEIDACLKKYNNKLTYDCIQDMNYLECCIDETLRKYPTAPTSQRQCTQTYRIPDTNIILEKGTSIVIPVQALHRDPKYYPEPLKFIPDRFNSDNLINKNFSNMPYMPFGEGPRICIGMRMGKMQTKVGLIFMLKNYQYHLNENRNNDIIINPASFLIQAKDGIHLKVTQRHYDK